MPGLHSDDPDEHEPLEPEDNLEPAQDSNEILAPDYQSDNLSSHDALDRKPYLVASRFQGNLPPPHLLQGYDDVVPGLANRLVIQMEKNGDHRRFMDTWSLFLRQGRSYLGLGAGLAVVITFLDVSYKLVMSGHDVAGTFLGTVDIVALAAVFVGVGRAKSRPKEGSQPLVKSDRRTSGQADEHDAEQDNDNNRIGRD